MENYDEKNVFNKILNKEIKCEEIENDKYTLSFEDINKQAPVHVLTIPKNKYKDFSSFSKNASDKEIANFCRSIFTLHFYLIEVSSVFICFCFFNNIFTYFYQLIFFK